MYHNSVLGNVFDDGDERYDSDDDADNVMLKIVIPRSDINEMC